ncbi:MAG: hypothetical protein Q7R74_01835, partial [bacterium]|nr:hypothetical protein [bacterium]
PGWRLLNALTLGLARAQSRLAEHNRLEIDRGSVANTVQEVDSLLALRNALDSGADSAYLLRKLSYPEETSVDWIRAAFEGGELIPHENQSFEEFLSQLRAYAKRAGHGQEERLSRTVQLFETEAEEFRNAFPDYKFGRCYVRYEGNGKEDWHEDSGDGMTLVRTYIGPSTEYRVPVGKMRYGASPISGSITLHRRGTEGASHRSPYIPKGEKRFALAFLLTPKTDSRA